MIVLRSAPDEFSAFLTAEGMDDAGARPFAVTRREDGSFVVWSRVPLLLWWVTGSLRREGLMDRRIRARLSVRGGA